MTDCMISFSQENKLTQPDKARRIGAERHVTVSTIRKRNWQSVWRLCRMSLHIAALESKYVASLNTIFAARRHRYTRKARDGSVDRDRWQVESATAH